MLPPSVVILLKRLHKTTRRIPLTDGPLTFPLRAGPFDTPQLSALTTLPPFPPGKMQAKMRFARVATATARGVGSGFPEPRQEALLLGWFGLVLQSHILELLFFCRLWFFERVAVDGGSG
jgi:hypothetical protein